MYTSSNKGELRGTYGARIAETRVCEAVERVLGLFEAIFVWFGNGIGDQRVRERERERESISN